MLAADQHVPGFLKLLLSSKSSCVHPPPRLLITSSMLWHDVNPIDWLNKFYNFYMAAVVRILSTHSLRIEANYRNEPSKAKLALCKPLLLL